MKKETVHEFLDALAELAHSNKDEALRKAMLEAIQTCRRWLELPWAQMQKPVLGKLNALEQEDHPLSQKGESQILTDKEQAKLIQLKFLIKIYSSFNQKIASTVRKAQVNRKG